MRWVLCCPLSNTLAPLYSAPRAGQRILAVSTRVHPAGRLPARSQLLHGARRCLLLPSPLFYFLPLCRGPQACQEQPPLPLCCKFRFFFLCKSSGFSPGSCLHMGKVEKETERRAQTKPSTIWPGAQGVERLFLSPGHPAGLWPGRLSWPSHTEALGAHRIQGESWTE